MNIIAVFNAGSSSLKFALFAAADMHLLYRGKVQNLLTAPHLVIKDANNHILDDRAIPGTGHTAVLAAVLDWIDRHDGGLQLVVAGHRIVHGGTKFVEPIEINQTILSELKKLLPLAPLHQQHNLAIVEALVEAKPELKQIACFDTAFHHAQSKLNTLFALPRAFYDLGIRRYGFHGLSYEYIASQLPRYTIKPRVIVAHLGNGASLCAMHDLQSVATSMGFSTLDGLMMGTRCGSLDPGVILYLQQEMQMPVSEIEKLLYEQSGLKGVSGITHDMQQLLASEVPAAQEAVALYCQIAAKQITALATNLSGLDALVFTGGIGENAAPIRAQICAHLEWLGLVIDRNANKLNHETLHSNHSAIEAYVIPTDEEQIIAKHGQEFLGIRGSVIT